MNGRLSRLLVALATFPAAALALDEPEFRLDAEVGYACFAEDRRYHGGLAGLDAGYAFTDFWVLRGGYALGEHRSKGAAFRVHQASVGVRYQLDVFEYVPWLSLSPTAYYVTGDDVAPQGFSGGVQAGLGFDWLMSESWALGFAARYHRLFGNDRFPAYLTLGARLGYRWVLGDPFQP